ncbi:MAG: DoxX family protein [Phycisphaerales bacterium]
MDATRTEMLRSAGLLILRVGIGGYMMTHGWGKVQMVLAGEFDKFPADPIGVGPNASLVLAALAEFVCAGLVVIGLGTRFAAAPVVFTMAVAAFVVHGSDPLLASGGRSKEPALIFMIVFLSLIFTGAGRLSLDALICGRQKRPTA